MVREQKLFFELLSDHVHGVSSAKKVMKDVNFEMLYSISKKHCVTGIVYSQIKENKDFCATDVKIQEAFKHQFAGSIIRSLSLENDLKRLKELFDKEKIPFALLKGAVVQKYYPLPELRTMGDIDIVIHPEHRDIVHGLMRDAGYNSDYTIEPVWVYSKNGITYEIHTQMMTSPYKRFDSCKTYFDNVWQYIDGENKEIEINYHMVYLIYHIAKHIYGRGCGFRQFLDLALIMEKEREHLNAEWLKKQLKKIELLEFAKTGFAFCERWFDVKAPFEGLKLDEDFFDTATNKMFVDGVFGKFNKENEISFITKHAHTSNSPYLLASIKSIMLEFFPCYSSMRVVEKYGFVDNRPWLLPFAWFYRLGLCLYERKLNRAVKTVKAITQIKAIKMRENYITEWGL